MRRVVNSAALGFLLACILPTQGVARAKAVPGQTDEQAATSIRSFRIGHLTVEAAHELVRRICSEAAPEVCRFVRFTSGGDGGTLEVRALPQTLAKFSEALTEYESVLSRQTLQIALLRAGPGSSQGLEDLPAGARQALRDAARLLPYEGYSLTGVGLLHTTWAGATRISGPGGVNFEVEVELDPEVTLESRHTEVRFELFSTHAPMGDDGQTNGNNFERLLLSTFTITPNETVVVGTSQLDGGDQGALVVLVTAIPVEAEPQP